MRIAICDDEVSMVQILEEKIKKLLPDAVIEKYLSGDELIASGSKPDILFVFFKSGTPFYVMDCLCHNLFQFLIGKWLNQIMKCSDIKCLKNILLCCCHKNEYHILIVLTKHLCRFHPIHSRHLNIQKKNIMVQTAGSHIKIFLRDIVYAEVYNRKVIIHTRSTDIEYYGKLQELSDMAGTDFFRTHRAYLVHFKYVEKYDATCVTMKNGTALIAKQNYPEFVKQYLKYNQRKGNEVR